MSEYANAPVESKKHNTSLRRKVTAGIMAVVASAGFAAAGVKYADYDQKQGDAFAAATTPEKLGALNDCSFHVANEKDGSVTVQVDTDYNSDVTVALSDRYDTLVTDREVGTSSGKPETILLPDTEGALHPIEVPFRTPQYVESSFEGEKWTNYETELNIVPEGYKVAADAITSMNVVVEDVRVFPHGYDGPVENVHPILACKPVGFRQ